MKPHIKLSANEGASRVIVCGSPERALLISEFLNNPKCIAKNREYHSYLGTYQGTPIQITSHGVGAAGAAICFQELIDIGAKTIVRIGTAGGLYDDTQIGDIVVPTGAVRQDGVSNLMVPKEFPALPDFEVTTHLRQCLQNENTSQKSLRFQSGVIVTSDLFYPGLLPSDLELYHKTGAVAVEMECSALFVIGMLRRIRTGALLVLDGNPLKWSEGHYDPNPERLKASVEACIHTALKALVAV